MTIPVQSISLWLPSALYVFVQRRRGLSCSKVTQLVGWKGASACYIALGLLFGLLPGLLLWVTPNLFLGELGDTPGVANSRYAGWTVSLNAFLMAWAFEAIYVALGEEVFFRGFIGGLLMRRLGFVVGNMLQAAIFLLPHLMLLTVSVQLWPLLVMQFFAGWLHGWLMHKSGSILPGWLAHSLGNAFGALPFMA
jgi:membrane protease YdiL (CAAX protease family)